MAVHFATSDFSSEQLEQIDLVLDRAQALLDALICKPDYLANEPLLACAPGECGKVINPMDIVVMLCEKLCSDGVNCFLPVHIETSAGDFPVELISDTYEAPRYVKEE